ncbi:MAG: MgtC/SapB family protein [Patescibacteria group bacterium]
MHIQELDILFRLALATILSSIIGLERQVRGKPAGLRTHALAGLGAAIMTLSGIMVAEQTIGIAGLTVDPTRMASIVIQGIGFLGAGVMIQSRGFVKGITTATTLWFVASIGIATGFGLWLIAAFSTMLALILLILFRQFEVEAEKVELLHSLNEENILSSAHDKNCKTGRKGKKVQKSKIW